MKIVIKWKIIGEMREFFNISGLFFYDFQKFEFS